MSSPRILYVEDNFLLALPVEIALEEAGYEVIAVANAEDALLQLQGNDRLPDLTANRYQIARRPRRLGYSTKGA